MRCILTHSHYNFRNFGMVGFHSAIWYKTILESRYNCLPYASSRCIFCTPVGSPCLIKLNLIRQSSDAAAKANKHVPSVLWQDDVGRSHPEELLFRKYFVRYQFLDLEYTKRS